jgi:hypothetical protein
MHGLIKDAVFRDNPPLDKLERGSQNDVAFKQKHLYDFDQPQGARDHPGIPAGYR